MWWIIAAAVVILVLVALFVRWGLSWKRHFEEIERAGGIDEWSKGIRERIAQKENVARSSNDATRRNNEFTDAVNILEGQIRQMLFSDVELAEITKDHNRANELILRATTATNKLKKLTGDELRLIKKFKSKGDAEKRRILESKIEDAEREVIACDKAVFASYEKIGKWVEIGKARAN